MGTGPVARSANPTQPCDIAPAPLMPYVQGFMETEAREGWLRWAFAVCLPAFRVPTEPFAPPLKPFTIPWGQTPPKTTMHTRPSVHLIPSVAPPSRHRPTPPLPAALTPPVLVRRPCSPTAPPSPRTLPAASRASSSRSRPPGAPQRHATGTAAQAPPPSAARTPRSRTPSRPRSEPPAAATTLRGQAPQRHPPRELHARRQHKTRRGLSPRRMRKTSRNRQI